jgi:hypothetical protein
MNIQTCRPYCFKNPEKWNDAKNIFQTIIDKKAITGIKRRIFIALYKVAASILFFEKAHMAKVDIGGTSAKSIDKTIIWTKPN